MLLVYQISVWDSACIYGTNKGRIFGTEIKLTTLQWKMNWHSICDNTEGKYIQSYNIDARLQNAVWFAEMEASQ